MPSSTLAPAPVTPPVTASVTASAAASAAVAGRVANPGPLGLAAFALTTFVLSLFNSGLIPNAALSAVVLPLALFYGGLAQFVAGIMEFRRGNTFGTTAFVSYGAFWMSFAGYVKFVVPTLPADQAHIATGWFLVAWFVFTASMSIAAMKLDVAHRLLFVSLALTFLFLALGDLTEVTALGHTGGFLGLLTAGIAWYISLAVVAEDTWGRKVLPLG
ncbi:acetate uptake transporter [Streptomyces sp. NBC_00536]|uniref:acetate uptake transporter n=1 Tax=Streptomyces sp. NBC_00536 TaxID=2975769 RepID=UPI002E81EAA7|nr:acetate uptake transporter [Streptomyces sp. NBC_00536]WUC78229.1 acetate uptake transporter [Streptomyces sp. NBC_00536]